MIQLDNATVYWGSNLDVLPTLPDNSVDSIVTDPPYELGFMGKSWDSSGIAYSVELWTECMRVLKPGGHLLAFGGSRTWHRLAVAIEDAGFEMRDSIAWLYGSGFPKSLDISKAIDKRGGATINQTRFIEWMRNSGVKAQQVDQALKDAQLISPTSNRAVHFYSYTQPQTPTFKMWSAMAHLFADLPNEFLALFAMDEAEREVIGSKMSGIANKKEKERHTIGASKSVEVDITAPATPEAIKWQGWGTALKPAFEPVVVARKPFKGTVASNVLEWGVGGLNIDGGRIGIADDDKGGWRPNVAGKNYSYDNAGNFLSDIANGKTAQQHPQGRWPANIILDPYTAELLDEQSGILKSGAMKAGTKAQDLSSNSMGAWSDRTLTSEFQASEGGASRFFYVAKASKRDRNEGLEGLPIASAAEMVDREEGSAGMNSPRAGAGRTSGSANIHPTVKPTSLMEYLIKLVTPEGGTVLDPFTGSGSTGKAALLNGFQFIGIELTEEYLPIIEGRLKWANEQRTQQNSQSEQEKKETLF